MIKLIASDLDGTLVMDNGKIDERVFNLINVLFKKNIIFVAASGRHYSQLNNDFKKVNGDMILIAHNGAIIKYNKMGRTLYSSRILEDDIKSVLNLKCATKMGADISLSSESEAYINGSSKELINIFKQLEVSTIKIKSYNDVKNSIYKISYYLKNGVNQSIIDYLNANLNKNLEFVISGDKWIDIMNKGVSKGKAIEIIQDKFNISKEDTMAFGDYYNDLTMFKVAYHSYAMKNAPDEVKKYARFVAETNNNNGVYNAIKKYALGN